MVTKPKKKRSRKRKNKEDFRYDCEVQYVKKEEVKT